jgi:shikimate kinase
VVGHEYHGDLDDGRDLRIHLGHLPAAGLAGVALGVPEGFPALTVAPAGAPGHIFLVGFMGSGKTTVGRELAKLMKLPFLDLDDTVARQAGRSIAEIFAEGGEQRFRALESRALAAAAAAPPAVIATGGGLMTRPQNRARMAGAGVSVWLHVPFGTIVARLSEKEKGQRPLFHSESAAQALYNERLEAYGRADIKIEVESGESPRQVATRIASKIRGEQCVI